MKMQKNSKMVHYEVIQNCLVIYISNDLDHHTVTLLRDYSDRLIEAGNIRHIVFDFTDVDFMDSSGIGMVLGRNRKMEFLGGKTYVTGISPSVDRIFSMSGLYRIISKYQERNEAYEPRK